MRAVRAFVLESIQDPLCMTKRLLVAVREALEKVGFHTSGCCYTDLERNISI